MQFRHLLLALVAATYSIAAPLEAQLDDRAITVTAADVDRLRLFAQYSAAAYCNGDNVPGAPVVCSANSCPEPTGNGATTVASFRGPRTGIEGFVATDPVRQLIVVSVRGSSNVRNWITNIVFAQAPCDLTAGCLVHTGFLSAYTEISLPILSAVRAARTLYPGYRVVTTGHSLGGAVATLAAAYLRRAGFPSDIYTFGAPRTGNQAFAAFVTAQAGGEYRVTHADDPVPRLPPIVLNYRHTSPEYWLRREGANATTTNYGPADVRVCEGTANVRCNAGTLGLDGEAHSYYFQAMGACGDEGFEWRKRRRQAGEEDISDEELEERLNRYALMDIEYANALGNG